MVEQNKKYDRWEVISPSIVQNNKIECICVCGTRKWVNISNLKSGKSRSCGCLSKEITRSRFVNLSGHQYGRLKVLNISKNINDKLHWLCKCICGNEKYIRSNDLRCGKILSCGCYGSLQKSKRKVKNLSGQRFGKLVVIKRFSKIGEGKKIKWLCECDCGYQKTISGSDLTCGKVISCGCSKSTGEIIIKDWLIKNNYDFKYQFKFPKKRLTYDFCIGNILLEYNGKQHYEPISYFGGKPSFKLQEIRDVKKQELAKENNYELYIIKYDEDIILKLQALFPVSGASQ